MDTGAHIVCNLLVQSRRSRPQLFALVALGAVIPDLPIIILYAWESLIAGYSESVIWSQRYFLPGWQNFIDTFNSIPIVILALVLSFAVRMKWLSVLLVGMLLHITFDLPLHHHDAHRHLFPFSDWKFISPVSYWDPRYHGDVMAVIQILFVAVGLIWLWIRHSGRFEKWMISLIGVGYALFQIFVAMVWAS